MQDFSESFAFSGPLPRFSPDGRLIAAAAEYRLVIRDADSLQVGALLKALSPVPAALPLIGFQVLQVIALYSCLDMIQHFEWCCNSDYILCSLYKRPIVQVRQATALCC